MVRDKVVVLAGGAGLLGRAFANAVAENGGLAIVADVDAEAAARVAREVGASHAARADWVRLDITDAASIDALIGTVQKRHGRIDALVNGAYPRNANYGRKLEDVSYADFCENLNLHLGGYFLTMQRVGLFFRSQGGGNIVNLSSIYGALAPRFEIYAGTAMTMPVEYAAIKSAVIHLTRYFAQYFKKDGIRVNSLSPGGIRDRQPDSFVRRYNEQSGAKGMLEPHDVIGALLFLLSDASRHVTGQNVVVDDGFSL
jgi:NAD(P)-dependent dehydrogenase (short-subunit alcohol dehydrogenase family)